MNAEIVCDLTDHVDHGCPAASRAEERVHVDRSIDRPIDVLVEQGFEIGGLALIDRAMKRARKTPETMLCHFWLVLEIWNFQKRQSRPNERHLRRRAEMPSTVAALNRAGWLKYNHRFCIAQLRRFQRIFDHLTVMAAYRRKRGRSEIAVYKPQGHADSRLPAQRREMRVPRYILQNV